MKKLIKELKTIPHAVKNDQLTGIQTAILLICTLSIAAISIAIGEAIYKN